MRVRTVPTSTTNITGFFHWMSGRSMTSDCRKAVFSSSGSNRPALRLCRRTSLRSSGAEANHRRFFRERAGHSVSRSSISATLCRCWCPSPSTNLRTESGRSAPRWVRAPPPAGRAARRPGGSCPTGRKPNVIVSVRNVPTVMGVGFLAARLAAKAIGSDDRHEAANQHHQAARDVPSAGCRGGRRRGCPRAC